MEKKFMSITNFAQAGINSDALPWDLPAGFTTEIRNVRIHSNYLTPFGGYATWATMPADHDSGFLMYVGAVSGTYWLIPGKDKVYVYDGATFFDISNPYGYASISDSDWWDGCLLASVPIISHPDHYPEYWSQQSSGIPLSFLPWDSTRTWKDAGESCRIIRSHKQFLFALDLRSDALELPDGVRWSAPADIGGVPPTWDPLDTTNVAGITALGGDGGQVIDGLSLRDAFVVYRENSISVFDYVGGQFIWRIRHLSSAVGLVAPNAIIEVKGKHFFIGDGDILSNDGNTITSLLHNRLRKRFVTNFDPDNYLNSYVVKNNALSEAWFCIPSSGSVYANIAYVYNWRDDTWSIRDLPLAAFANYGPQNSPPLYWSAMIGTWEGNSGAWNQRQRSPFDDSVLAVTKPAGPGQSGKILALDTTLAENEEPYDSVIERVGFALEGLHKTTTVQSIYPHIRSPGKVQIQLGSQDYAGAPTRWKQPVDFTPEKDRKVDIRSTGSLHCFRILANGVTTIFEFSGLDFDYIVAGER